MLNTEKRSELRAPGTSEYKGKSYGIEAGGTLGSKLEHMENLTCLSHQL